MRRLGIQEGVVAMSRHVAAPLMAHRLGLTLFLMFAGLALLLTGFGLYAVVASAVSQQTREIGIRVALGAEAGRVLGLVARQAAARRRIVRGGPVEIDSQRAGTVAEDRGEPIAGVIEMSIELRQGAGGATGNVRNIKVVISCPCCHFTHGTRHIIPCMIIGGTERECVRECWIVWYRKNELFLAAHSGRTV